MKVKPRINTRDYTPDDYPSLYELWTRCDLSQPERDDRPEVIERCNQLGGRLLVMEDPENKRIIGSSWMTWDGRRIYLHHFGILPEYQGMGLGTSLAEASMKWLREQGQQVKLEVHRENHQAKKMYEKLGFFAFSDYDIYMIRDFNK